jgi:hypothetical protein
MHAWRKKCLETGMIRGRTGPAKHASSRLSFASWRMLQKVNVRDARSIRA